MKIKIKKAAAGLLAAAALFSYHGEALASVHNVNKGDTLWKISSHYGVPISKVMTLNKLNSHLIYPGQSIKLPSTITQAEKNLLAQLVHAEAKGEPYAGKVAVATVVLNRVDSPDFPNTIKEVIYQISNGHYAFTPVANGEINRPADGEAMKAVNEALAFRGKGKGSLFFYNPQTSTSKWILSREVTTVIGKHRFAK
ncbi:cell wall hydrolase [Bacillus sp. J33]|uniref:cell wall hydrolase n=1 Tax=Bacillus sp. J33 TaxID=935836 RepID=UPI0004B6899A|nr:cell wall hydrolase [Bacillus sp. J33]